MIRVTLLRLHRPPGEGDPVGKNYASIVDDGKIGFLKAEQIADSMGIKIPLPVS